MIEILRPVSALRPRTTVLPRKRQPKFVYRGFGFPVKLVDALMVRSLGIWTPDVDWAKLERRVARKLNVSAKTTRAQSRFLERHLAHA